MYKIVRHEAFSDVTFLWEIEALDVAASAEPGHFVMLRLHDGSSASRSPSPISIARLAPSRPSSRPWARRRAR